METVLMFILLFLLYVFFGTLLVVLTITPIEDILALIGWLTQRAVDGLIVRPFKWIVARFARR